MNLENISGSIPMKDPAGVHVSNDRKSAMKSGNLTPRDKVETSLAAKLLSKGMKEYAALCQIRNFKINQFKTPSADTTVIPDKAVDAIFRGMSEF
jgi:hypothetical protein